MFFFAIKRPLFACSTIAPSLMLLTVTAMAAPMEAGPPTQPTSLLVHRVADTDAISAGEKKDRRDHHVAKRIKELHDKLKVTADQEALWAAVAAVMQENESKMHDSITHRAELTRTMNAIDDLKSYQLVTD